MGRPVIHDQDGHADDLVATLLLAVHPAVDLRAVVIGSGDCLPDASARALVGAMERLGLAAVPVYCQAHDLPHPFPLAWQQESLNYLRDLGAPEPVPVDWRGTEGLIQSVRDCPEPPTVLVTGPCSTLAAALKNEPALAGEIDRVVIMGGSLEAGGNVEGEPGHDGSAEWNFYADPGAARDCLESELAIDLVTLDVTNYVPMSAEFVRALSCRGGAAAVAARILRGTGQQNYYFWDTLAALLTCEIEFLPRRAAPVQVLTEAPAQGRLVVSPTGRTVRVFEPGPGSDSLRSRVEERFIELLGAAPARVL